MTFIRKMTAWIPLFHGSLMFAVADIADCDHNGNVHNDAFP